MAPPLNPPRATLMVRGQRIGPRFGAGEARLTPAVEAGFGVPSTAGPATLPGSPLATQFEHVL